MSRSIRCSRNYPSVYVIYQDRRNDGEEVSEEAGEEVSEEAGNIEIYKQGALSACGRQFLWKKINPNYPINTKDK